MSKLIYCVGIPASGKSTFTNNFSECRIHSSDKLREELFGDVSCNTKNVDLFDELHKRIRTDLANGIDVVYDATNINYKRRMLFLESLKKIDCEKICYILATPYEDCIRYNANRSRVVPEEVIKNMYKNFHIPFKKEGFDEIKIVWNYNKEDFDLEKLLESLDEMEQGNPYHTMTVGHHMRRCKRNVEALTNDGVLSMVALIHDIGKPFCCEFNKEKYYFSYYNHQNVSAYNAMFYLKSLGYSDDKILEICNLIQFHMRLFNADTEASKEKIRNLLGDVDYQRLVLLHIADKSAK